MTRIHLNRILNNIFNSELQNITNTKHFNISYFKKTLVKKYFIIFYNIKNLNYNRYIQIYLINSN